MRLLIALLSLSLLTGCISFDTEATLGNCQGGLKPVTTAELFFGRSIGDSPGVSDADWRAFVDQEVTPRFPDGLTVIDAAGQWRGATGTIVREPSKALLLVLGDEPGEREKLDAIRAAYKARFHQDAVMLLERRGCVGF